MAGSSEPQCCCSERERDQGILQVLASLIRHDHMCHKGKSRVWTPPSLSIILIQIGQHYQPCTVKENIIVRNITELRVHAALCYPRGAANTAWLTHHEGSSSATELAQNPSKSCSQPWLMYRSRNAYLMESTCRSGPWCIGGGNVGRASQSASYQSYDDLRFGQKLSLLGILFLLILSHEHCCPEGHRSDEYNSRSLYLLPPCQS